MNRVIKFRAWDSRHKEMTYITSLYWFEEEGIHDMSEGKAISGNYTFMQFTGLYDDNGKEVYEGDVLLYSNMEGHHTEFRKRFVVQFGQQDLGHSAYQQTIGWNATPVRSFGKPSMMDSGGLSNGIHCLFDCHSTEVIGNIHENPELLEAQ